MRLLLASLAFVAVLLFARGALAHAVGLSRGEYARDGDALDVTLTFSRRELAALLPALDADHDGTPSEVELAAGDAALEAKLVRRISVEAAGRACDGDLQGARLEEADGVTVRARYRCADATSPVAVTLSFLDDLPRGHRHVVHATSGERSVDTVLFGDDRRFELGPGATPQSRGALSFLGVGVHHILTGYDHLVFLLGLVLIGGRRKALLFAVTAFTLGHSLTLGLATLGVYAPSPRIVEPAIALSIAYVGVENFLVRDADKRWRITFPFGLVHGFGFAGALSTIALPRAELVGALFCFNVGVEAGQLAVLAVVLPLLHLARKQAWFAKRGVLVVSAAIAAAGLFWFVLRTFGPEA